MRRLGRAAGLAIAVVSLQACTGLATREGETARFTPCPDKANCVSSEESRERYRVERMHLVVPPEDAWWQVKEVINAMPRAKVVEEEGFYLRAEFRSLLLRFVDNVEIRLNETDASLSIKSASVLGHYDMGVNAERVARIRAALHERGTIE